MNQRKIGSPQSIFKTFTQQDLIAGFF